MKDDSNSITPATKGNDYTETTPLVEPMTLKVGYDEDVEIVNFANKVLTQGWHHFYNFAGFTLRHAYDIAEFILRPPIEQSTKLIYGIPKTVLGVINNTISTIFDVATLGPVAKTLGNTLKIIKGVNPKGGRNLIENSKLLFQGSSALLAGSYLGLEAVHITSQLLNWREGELSANPLIAFNDLENKELNGFQLALLIYLLIHFYDNGLVIGNRFRGNVVAHFSDIRTEARFKYFDKVKNQILLTDPFSEQSKDLYNQYQKIRQDQKDWSLLTMLYAFYDQTLALPNKMLEFFQKDTMGKEITFTKWSKYQKTLERIKQIAIDKKITSESQPSAPPADFETYKNVQVDKYSRISPHSLIAYPGGLWNKKPWQQIRLETQLVNIFKDHQIKYMQTGSVPLEPNEPRPSTAPPQEIIDLLNGAYLADNINDKSDEAIAALYMDERIKWIRSDYDEQAKIASIVTI